YSHRSLGSRFAWDLQVVNKDGTLFRGSGSRNEDFASFEAPVRAVADGTVVRVVDGIPDHLPGSPDGTRPRGNEIVLRHGDHWSRVLHLRSGSIRVAVGDTVKAGQVIAAVGDSGYSRGPHVCVSLASRPYPEEASMPCHLRTSEKTGAELVA